MDDLIAKALHAARQHFDEGGFLDSLRGMFSGPDYLSTGKEASFANLDPNDETTADFFKADRAARMAQQAKEADVPLPPRRPFVVPDEAVTEAPRLRAIAAPPPAPASRVSVNTNSMPIVGPYDFGQRVTEHQIRSVDGNLPRHLAEQPGFGYAPVVGNPNLMRADAQPEVPTSRLQNYTLPTVALARQVMAPTIPDEATALANVERLHNAGVTSGPELDAAGRILQAHNLAKEENIPVEAALQKIGGPLAPPRAPAAIPANAMAYAPDDKLTQRVAPETGKMVDRAPMGLDLTPTQRDYIIRTIAAETSGKTPEESRAIAHVILNRIQSGKYGATPEAVLFAKKQFEPWSNPAGANYPMRFSPESRRYLLGTEALDAALAGEDITGGATNFWAPKAQAALGRRPPAWGRTGGVDIGETRFHKLERADGGSVEDHALMLISRQA